MLSNKTVFLKLWVLTWWAQWAVNAQWYKNIKRASTGIRPKVCLLWSQCPSWASLRGCFQVALNPQPCLFDSQAPERPVKVTANDLWTHLVWPEITFVDILRPMRPKEQVARLVCPHFCGFSRMSHMSGVIQKWPPEIPKKALQHYMEHCVMNHCGP